MDKVHKTITTQELTDDNFVRSDCCRETLVNYE
jgi:hypothetical protein